MLKKIGAFIFFFIMTVAALGIANSLAITFYDKPLLTVIKDFLFILTRK